MMVDEFSNMSSIKDALKGVFDTPSARRAMGPAHQAQRCWYQVIGPV